MCKAVLERGQSRAVPCCVGIDAISVKTLAKHQQRLAMWIGVAGLSREIDISGKRYIARDLLPHKVESIDRRPEISACGSDAISSRGRVVHEISRRSNAADIRLAFEDS